MEKNNEQHQEAASRSLLVKYRMFDRMYEEDAESAFPYIISMHIKL